MIPLSEYKSKRHSFFTKIPDFWYDQYDKEYSLYHTFVMPQHEIEEIRVITERVGHIFFKTASLLRKLPNESLFQLGIPKKVIPFIRHKVIQPESIIARLDLVKTRDGYKLLEINSDTPTFIVECFSINHHVCEHFGYKNPNQSFEKQLSSAIKKAIIESCKSMKQTHANVVFTAHSEHSEDWNTTRYLQNISGVPSQCIPLHELLINDDGVFDPAGRKIDVLYRQTYPIEHLIYDKDQNTSELIGLQLLQLVQDGKLAIINPLSAFLLQSKAVQALIWGLYEEDSYFLDTEREWIRSYFLPTYLEPDLFLENAAYVKKPAFGREGDTVEIFDRNNDLLLRDSHKSYQDELPIYQKYVDLPTVELETEQGFEKLHYLIGSFLIAGKASAIGIRAGGQITGNESYFLPVGLEKEEYKGENK